jgi:AcrR family transcriptional regulator
MGRKSLKEQRTVQILDAFERCVVNYGLQSVTLQKIADEAGVTRSILRHYIGNRSDLLRVLLQRLEIKYIQELFSRLSNSTDHTLTDDLIDFLFEDSLELSATDETVIRAMIEASARDADLKNDLLELYQTYEDDLTDVLIHHFPQTPIEKCRTVAHIVISASHGNYSLLWLGFDHNRYPFMKNLLKSVFEQLAVDELE